MINSPRIKVKYLYPWSHPYAVKMSAGEVGVRDDDFIPHFTETVLPNGYIVIVFCPIRIYNIL